MNRSIAFSKSRTGIVASVLICLGIGIRYLMFRKYGQISESLWSDMSVYFRNAGEIHHGIWMPYHFFQSIGYPLLISALMHLSTLYLDLLSFLQFVSSCLSLIIFFLTCRMFFTEKISLVCLLFGSLHFPWIMYQNFALPESFFTLLLSICAYTSVIIARSDERNCSAVIVWAVSFALALWLKGTHAFWGPVFLICLLWQKKKKALPSIILISSIVGTCLLVHGYLSWTKINKFQFTASTGGLNFVEGKCESKKNTDSLGFTWLSPLYHQLDINTSRVWERPFTDSGYFFKQGIKCIQRNPFVLIQSVEAVPYLFYGNHMWPFNQKSYQNYARLYDLVFALFAIGGLAAYWSLRKLSPEEFIIWSVPILSLFLCAYIFKSELRYRVPFDLWIIPVAIAGWSELIRKRRIS